MQLNIKTAAYRGAPETFTENGRQEFRERFSELNFRFVSENPEVIYFLSGGSEQEAIKALQPGKYYLLLAGSGQNAWAAATEVKAWADHKRISTRLISMEDAVIAQLMMDYARICNAYSTLKGRQAGLIGNVSHWLVASEFPLILAKERFGINIRHLPWSSLPDYLSFEPDQGFLKEFHGNTTQNLENEARIYSFLLSVINSNQLNGLTLECFNMVNDHAVTACLSLALLNSRGIVAGCEGDLVSLTGMMLVQALTGTIPWMANLARIEVEQVLFAHCTAPLNLVGRVEIPTHFETGKSAAVQGKLQFDAVTVFRLNHELDKAFISTGKVALHPQHEFACRTQIEITLPEKAIEKLRNNPLGNHHLIIPGNHQDLLEWACRYKGIEIL